MSNSTTPTPITEKRKGLLSDSPFPTLLRGLFENKSTAVLEVISRPIVKMVIIEHGIPVDCRSNLIHETLSRFMVEKGLFTRAKETSFLNRAAKRGMLFGELVRDEGIVSAADLFKILQQNLAKKLLDIFTWDEGEYNLSFDVPDVESPLRVNVPQLIFTGCSRFVSAKQIQMGIGYLVGQSLVLHPRPPVDLRRLHLDKNQKTLLSLLDNPMGLTDLTEKSEASFEDTTRFVYALMAMGLLVTEKKFKQIKDTQPIKIVKGDFDESNPKILGEPGDVNELMVEYLRHRRVDSFDLLRVPAAVSEDVLKDALIHYCHRVAPWRFQGPELDKLGGKAEELFIAGVKAYNQISDTNIRQELVRTRATSDMKITQRAADELVINSDLLDPEVKFSQGRKYLEQGQLAKALQSLDLALKCDPQNSLYRAEAAYCWYLSSPGTGATLALPQLRKAMEIDPGCGLAYFYFGEIHRREGDFEIAEDFLQRSIKLLAPDRRPIESLKALRKALKVKAP